MAKCCVCRTEEADTWRFCSPRKQYVCLRCELKCPNYSRNKLLPNGTRCRIQYTGLNSKFWSYLTNKAKVESAKGKYEAQSIDVLRQIYKELHKAHSVSGDPEVRAKLRVELAAICEVAAEKKRGA